MGSLEPNAWAIWSLERVVDSVAEGEDSEVVEAAAAAAEEVGLAILWVAAMDKGLLLEGSEV